MWHVDPSRGTITNSSHQPHGSSSAVSHALSPPPLLSSCQTSAEQPSSAVWSFDCVLDVCSSNESVFERLVRPVVHSSVSGMNGTCLAYGQTSSGKSHTMTAMLRLAAQLVFSSGQQVSVAVSYFEIYNEQIRDLTHSKQQQQAQRAGSSSGGQRLRVRQHPMYGVYIAGLTETGVADVAELMAVVETAEARRAVASTAMNAHSSRAHTVCRFTLSTSSAAGEVRQSVFQLVDLAGSERSSLSQTSGARLREGGHINKSLLELSTVISKLSQRQQRQHKEREVDGEGRHTGSSGSGGLMDGAAHMSHIPYRNSTLTRVLEPALGGNSRTAIIACINAVRRT